jgi:hypothetical protein
MRALTEIQAQVRAAAAEASRGCGLSDVLLEARLHAAYVAILAQASEEERPVVEAELLQSGFDLRHGDVVRTHPGTDADPL